MSNAYDVALFWFRRDLRDYDNAGLAAALQSARQVYCVFVFDRDILDLLPRKYDRRVDFICRSIGELGAALRKRGGGLLLRHGRASEEIPRLAREVGASAVFTNHDYEPRSLARDEKVAAQLHNLRIDFRTFKDQAIFERDEVLTQAGTPFTVFTPYKNAWLKRLSDADLAVRDVELSAQHLAHPSAAVAPPAVAEIAIPAALGFEPTNINDLLPAGMSGANSLLDDFRQRIAQYREARNFPAVKGVSYLSVHLRFGTISIRELARIAQAEQTAGADTWLSELIWRDFYFQILYHFPYVATSAFRPQYNRLKWENSTSLFQAWCEGRTGYPIVDAAMRQINETGYMHNRLRMIVASFLTKDLLIDWRWGEQYFADNLNDFDLAANNGGWQWAASTGCDAQPYFRIFNPVTQSEKFDPRGKFIHKYLPELAAVPDQYINAPWTLPAAERQAGHVLIGRDYPAPVVDHTRARAKALALYKAVKIAPDDPGSAAD